MNIKLLVRINAFVQMHKLLFVWTNKNLISSIGICSDQLGFLWIKKDLFGQNSYLFRRYKDLLNELVFVWTKYRSYLFGRIRICSNELTIYSDK